MGMAASQARLLSITARLSNSEFQIQEILNQKLNITDQSDLITKEYEQSLQNKKMVMNITTTSGVDQVDLSYKELTKYNQSSPDNLFIVTDTSGKVVITADMLKSYQSYQLYKVQEEFKAGRAESQSNTNSVAPELVQYYNSKQALISMFGVNTPTTGEPGVAFHNSSNYIGSTEGTLEYMMNKVRG